MLEASVADAIQTVRRAGQRGQIFYLYVVDREGVLRGIVSIRNLLLSKDTQKIADVCASGVVSLSVDAPVSEAYRLFSESRFLSLPIIDAGGKIRGVIHAHELIEEYEKETEELFEERTRGELFALLGIKAEDTSRGLFATAAGRLPWLLLNVLGGALSTLFIHFLGGKLRDAVEFLAFVPILLVISESIGMQTASVVIADLHRASSAKSTKPAKREIGVALILGTCSGLIIAAMALLWKGSGTLTTAIGLSILLGSLYVSGLGCALPSLIHRFRGDPRIAAGPVVLALADCGTLLVYLLLGLALTR